jgi:hypothetical protein
MRIRSPRTAAGVKTMTAHTGSSIRSSSLSTRRYGWKVYSRGQPVTVYYTCYFGQPRPTLPNTAGNYTALCKQHSVCSNTHSCRICTAHASNI